MGRSLAFTMYCGGYISKFILEGDGAVVMYNGDRLTPSSASWSFNTDGEKLTMNWNYKPSGHCLEHVYRKIDEETSLYELKTKDGYSIPNGFHKSRCILIRTPTTSRSRGRMFACFDGSKNLIYALCVGGDK